MAKKRYAGQEESSDPSRYMGCIGDIAGEREFTEKLHKERYPIDDEHGEDEDEKKEGNAA